MNVLTNLMAFYTLKRGYSFSHRVLASGPFSFCLNVNLWSECGVLITFFIQCLAPRSYFTGYIAKVYILLHSVGEWIKNMGHASALGLASGCSLGTRQGRNDPPDEMSSSWKCWLNKWKVPVLHLRSFKKILISFHFSLLLCLCEPYCSLPSLFFESPHLEMLLNCPRSFAKEEKVWIINMTLFLHVP